MFRLMYKPRPCSCILPLRTSKLQHESLAALAFIQCSRSSFIAKHQGHLRVQRVRVRSRWLTWKKAATLFLGTGLSLMLASTIIGILAIGIEDTDDINLVKQQLEGAVDGSELDLEGDKELDHQEKGKDLETPGQSDVNNLEIELPEDTPEGAWFIPLGLARKLPSRYYSSDDPEWQAFIEFAEDKDRQARIKNELCSMVLKSLSQNKNVEKALGKGVRCKSYWLDVDYPPGPPSEYERYGLEWTDEYIALLHRPISSIQVKRIEKALWPAAVTMSAYSTLQEIVQTQYERLRRALGIAQDGQPPYDGRRKYDESQMLQSPSTSLGQSSDGSGQTEKRQSTPITSLNDPLYLLPNYPRGDPAITPGLALFRRKLSKKWKPALSSPPSGSIFLQGLIEYRGSVATCTVDVAAAYIATENKWHLVLVSIKRIQPNVQWPKGVNRRV